MKSLPVFCTRYLRLVPHRNDWTASRERHESGGLAPSFSPKFGSFPGAKSGFSLAPSPNLFQLDHDAQPEVCLVRLARSLHIPCELPRGRYSIRSMSIPKEGCHPPGFFVRIAHDTPPSTLWRRLPGSATDCASGARIPMILFYYGQNAAPIISAFRISHAFQM